MARWQSAVMLDVRPVICAVNCHSDVHLIDFLLTLAIKPLFVTGLSALAQFSIKTITSYMYLLYANCSNSNYCYCVFLYTTNRPVRYDQMLMPSQEKGLMIVGFFC